MVKDTNIIKNKSSMNLNFVAICDFYMKNNVAQLSLTPSAKRRYNAQVSRVQTYFDLTINQISLQYFYETVRSLKVSNAEKKRDLSTSAKMHSMLHLFSMKYLYLISPS